MYTVKLSACGNPDFRQGRYLPGVRARRVRVASLDEASKACRDYIRENELGMGNWNGGQVFDASGTPIVQVSCNGRVWKFDDYRAGRLVEMPSDHAGVDMANREVT